MKGDGREGKRKEAEEERKLTMPLGSFPFLGAAGICGLAGVE